MTWASLDLDQRVIDVLQGLEYINPLISQLESIPHILSGNDVFVHSPTGSGKTIIILATILQQLVQQPDFQTVILVPTHELASQTFTVFRETLEIAKQQNISYKTSLLLDEQSLILPFSNIVISTPFLLSKNLFTYEKTGFLVIDEADLMLQMMQETALRSILAKISAKTQKTLLSASLDDDVENFKLFSLRSPILVNLSAAKEVGGNQIQQYFINYVDTTEKFLYLYSLTKLRLLQGNIIIFAKSQKQGYRIHLFLKTFSMNSIVFDPKMPQNIRLQTLSDFNVKGGIFIIAGKSEEVDASRGLDLNKIDFVIAFNCYSSAIDYQHAIGRCCRGINKNGSSYLFVEYGKDDANLVTIQNSLKEQFQSIELFPLELSELQAFKYRVRDVINRYDDKAVKVHITQQVKQHILQSDHLKSLVQSEIDQTMLKKIKGNKVQQVAQLPDYLLNAARSLKVKSKVGSSGMSGFATMARKRKEENMKKKKDLKKAKIAAASGWKKDKGRIAPPPK
ncbi:ATP-dependent RNA helicase [Spironucleus salmonicida]|uniref:RNA helicase n=1 Tax=Spironucleus salmonicida TaxID=348837 RepID=V6LNF4_9EUKA|nr:ATP-dependent RNA helicase [Spironucleus salmonicida]|eukprot:EST46192.1 ATP-dependent RNA helicase [Spironucleus salmonicida]